MFREAIAGHIVEEEGPLFSKAQKILSSAEAEAIGREFLQEEQRLMGPQKAT